MARSCWRRWGDGGSPSPRYDDAAAVRDHRRFDPSTLTLWRRSGRRSAPTSGAVVSWSDGPQWVDSGRRLRRACWDRPRLAPRCRSDDSRLGAAVLTIYGFMLQRRSSADAQETKHVGSTGAYVYETLMVSL